VNEKIGQLVQYLARRPWLVLSVAGNARMQWPLEWKVQIVAVVVDADGRVHLRLGHVFDAVQGTVLRPLPFTIDLARHAEQRLPYISVLTNPTTAGVMASFASLGDVIIAEPKSMIGFAGPRVIKETTHQDLPERFQTAEFLQEHGLIDMIVHRKKMREQLSQLLSYFSVVP